MWLLPEFSVVLGTCAFSAMSLLSALLYKDISSTLHKLSQSAAVLGLSGLFISQGSITGVFSWDPAYSTLLWMSMVSLGAALASVVGLNVYLAAVKRRMMLASTLGGTITLPSASTSVLVIASSENTEGTVSIASPYTRLSEPLLLLPVSARSAFSDKHCDLSRESERRRHRYRRPLRLACPGLASHKGDAAVWAGYPNHALTILSPERLGLLLR
jgi:hypothetical protein